MSAEEVDEYLSGVEEPKRSTLQALRRMILEILPESEEGISYRVPAFRLDGTPVAGFAAFTDHLSYLPFSGSVLSQLADQLQGYTMTKSSLHFPVNRPLPKELVQKLIAVRLAERALLAVTDHVNLFLYDGAIVPDPEGIITSPASIRTRPRERSRSARVRRSTPCR